MNALLFLSILIQEPTVEASIGAFLNGDAGARVEILKRGPRVIPALLNARDRKPEAIDAIHAQLRQGAAYPAVVPWGSDFVGGTMGLSLNLEKSTSLDSIVGVFQRRLIALCSDRFDGARLKNTKIMIEARSPQELVEGLCRQAGLDYGYFHNFLVIGRPERLWACREPAKVPDLDAASREKASDLVAKLGDESIEARDAATRELVKLGRAVIPLLEAQDSRKDREIAARCDAIIIQLRAAAQGAFGPSSCLRQELPAKDQDLLKHLQLSKPHLTFEKTPLADVAALLKKEHAVECVLGEAHRDLKVTLITSGQSLLDLLSAITQVRDLDLVIQDAKVIIDTREAIEKLVSAGK